MKLKLTLIFAVIAAFISGCASGPSYSETTIPPLAAGKGRIYFYRTATMGAALKPSVKVNGLNVGTSRAKGFFYYDAAPGEYKVETSTEVTRRLTLKLEAGDTRYVKMGVSMGFLAGHVYPELVDTSVGSKEIQGCKYTRP